MENGIEGINGDGGKMGIPSAMYDENLLKQERKKQVCMKSV